MIGTVHETNASAIEAISSLYGQIQADVTYSTGRFWRDVSYTPEWKSDIEEQKGVDDLIVADARHLPVPDGHFKSIMFDPPFIVAHGKQSIMGNRFSSYKTMKLLWAFYNEAIKELYRVTQDSGFVVVKCQDTVSSKKQHWSHVHMMMEADKNGFYVRDLFVLLAKSRMKTHNTRKQQHARKFHSYFLVLEKSGKSNAFQTSNPIRVPRS